MSHVSVRRCLMAEGERCVQGPCETCETLSSPSDICTSLYKIGNVGHQQRELRFPLGILHCHYLPPAVLERRTMVLAPIGSLRSGWREEVMVLVGVCAFCLPYMPGKIILF